MIPGGQQNSGGGAMRAGGRSGNDFLAHGGDGYESWAAEGPSGVTGRGGYPGEETARSAAEWASSVPAERESSSGRGGAMFGLLVGVGVGAALMYFLDGERGAERRRQLSGRLTSALDSGRRAAQGAVSQVRERVAAGRGTSAPSPAANAGGMVSDVDEPTGLGTAGVGDGRPAENPLEG